MKRMLGLLVLVGVIGCGDDATEIEQMRMVDCSEVAGLDPIQLSVAYYPEPDFVGSDFPTEPIIGRLEASSEVVIDGFSFLDANLLFTDQTSRQFAMHLYTAAAVDLPDLTGFAEVEVTSRGGDQLADGNGSSLYGGAWGTHETVVRRTEDGVLIMASGVSYFRVRGWQATSVPEPGLNALGADFVVEHDWALDGCSVLNSFGGEGQLRPLRFTGNGHTILLYPGEQEELEGYTLVNVSSYFAGAPDDVTEYPDAVAAWVIIGPAR